jgi:hypothetical protein
LSLTLDRSPSRVYTAPDQLPLAFESTGGRVRVVVPEIRGHQMIVFE